MSYARGFGLNGKSMYWNVETPTVVSCNFTVASTNTNGLGLTSLKSNGYIENVFMHTTQTPGANNGFTNPNPASGFAVVQFKQNLNIVLGSLFSIQSPNSGSDVKIDNSAMTAGQAYVITTLGNATAAKWQAVGVPPGVTAAVGVSFIALTNGGAGNVLTSRVQVPSVSGIVAIEQVGSSVLSVNSSIAANSGQQMIVQFLGATNSSTTTLIPTAPATGSIVELSFVFDRGSVTIDGL